MRTSKQRLLLGLSVLTLVFIWGNSLMPGTVSGAFSDWVGQVLARIFGGVSLPETGHGTLRKLAHGTEYLILGVELWLFLRHMLSRDWSLVGLCGVAAALFSSLLGYLGFFDPEWRFIPMVGASGSIYGIMAACAVLFPHARVQLLFPPVILSSRLETRSMSPPRRSICPHSSSIWAFSERRRLR